MKAFWYWLSGPMGALIYFGVVWAVVLLWLAYVAVGAVGT